MSDPLKDLSPALLAKIGSIVGHVEELRSPGGSEQFDGAAIDALLRDPEVVEWLKAMRAIAFVPQPRKRP
jgi:hypothetical protein